MVRALIKTYRLSTDLGQVRAMRDLVAAVWGLFADDEGASARISREAFLRPRDGLADTIIASLDVRGVRQSGRGGPATGPPTELPPDWPAELPLDLPPNIKPCPACGLLLEKICGDDTMMCGCEARRIGGTYPRALAGGGCGHEFNFRTLEPIGGGSGRPGEPANERQVLFGEFARQNRTVDYQQLAASSSTSYRM